MREQSFSFLLSVSFCKGCGGEQAGGINDNAIFLKHNVLCIHKNDMNGKNK